MSEKLHEVHEEITINAPVNEVFDYLGNREHYVEWLPSLEEIKNMREENGVPHWDYSYRMLGFKFEGTNKLAEEIPNKKRVLSSVKGMKNNWVFNFEEVSGGTHIDATISYEVPVPVLGKLAEGFVKRANHNEVKAALQNIKAKFEA